MDRIARSIIVISLIPLVASADTFVHRATGRRLHGYATSRTEGGKTVVVTRQKGIVGLNLAQYTVLPNAQGRNNSVAIVSVPEEIKLEMEVDAFARALVEEADKGPLFILIEIDTPGGRVDLTMRMCSAITNLKHCRTVAFLHGGKYGGAYSAGAAVALACDRIYMAPNSAIGAATAIALANGRPTGLARVFGAEAGEKISSAWRNYLAGLAQKNNRPGLLAKAMENKDIEVIEVLAGGRRYFIEPVNRRADERVVRTWSKKGSLLTLTGTEAVQCGIADKIATSREQVLFDSGAADAVIIENTRTNDARNLYKRLTVKVDKLYNSLDLRIKELAVTTSRVRVLAMMRQIKKDAKYLINLKKNYPDVKVNVGNLQKVLNSIEAQYNTIRSMR